MKLLKVFIAIILFVNLLSCSDKDDFQDLTFEETQVETRQDFWDNFQVINACEANNLTYFVDNNCVGSDYGLAIINAIDAYNNLNSALRFERVNPPMVADLVFDCVNGTFCASASSSAPFFNNNAGVNDPNVQTNFPSGGTIGGLIHLEINWGLCPCDGTFDDDCDYENVEFGCILQRTVMHEIGHALGIAHNGQTSNFGNPTNIIGTPDVQDDPGSVFNSGPTTFDNCDWCDAPCVFNANDIIAIGSLYPALPFEIEGPNEVCLGKSGLYSISQEVESVIWYGGPGLVVEQLKYTAKVTAVIGGPGTLFADVEIDGCVFTISRTIDFGTTGPPTPIHIRNNISLKFDPCRSLIYIEEIDPNNDISYQIEYEGGLNNTPRIATHGDGVALSLRVLYGPGDTACFRVSATNLCGTTYLSCPVCFTTPDCGKDGGEVEGQISNLCSSGGCANGQECQDGLCCTKDEQPGDECINNSHCPRGFICVKGNCCNLQGNCL